MLIVVKLKTEYYPLKFSILIKSGCKKSFIILHFITLQCKIIQNIIFFVFPVCYTKLNVLFNFFQSCLSCVVDHYLHITSCVDKSCPNATFLSDVTECRHCPHACSVCVSPKVCVRCHTGYYLSVSGQCLTGCSDGQKPDKDGRCMPCPSSCKTCAAVSGSDFCTDCNGDKVLVNGTCLDSCPEGYYRDRDSCRRCHTSCQTCSGSEMTSCLSCKPGWTLNGTCLSCPIGQFFDSSMVKCRECFKDCLTCSGPLSSDCVTCRSPYLVRKTIPFFAILLC
jgi:proprotein convertase subtilisin/kexin type 5